MTASGSGLDPHISVKNAVARHASRGNAASAMMCGRGEIAKATTSRQFGIFGEAGVNVLKLNLALDAVAPKK